MAPLNTNTSNEIKTQSLCRKPIEEFGATMSEFKIGRGELTLGSMRQSALISRTLKEVPSDEPSLNAQLLMRAGFVDKQLAGVYTYLPLGQRVLARIENIVRHEMAALGSQEMLMPTIHPKDNWTATGRWDTFEPLFKIKSRYGGRDFALGPTHEESVTPTMKSLITSYKDLPLSVFQIQTKLRDEPRPRSGMLRGREFRMKDMYSFHQNEQDLDEFYNRAIEAYTRIFERLGIGDVTYFTYASGGSFSQYSHEFQAVTPRGEDTVYLCGDCEIAVNKEIIEDLKGCCPECGKSGLTEERGIEVGNIFKLMTKFSEPFDMTYVDQHGAKQPVLMGCYGLGTSRTMGSIVELCHDDSGIVWPANIAPFQVHLISLSRKDEETAKADEIFNNLTAQGIDVLYDERTMNAGGKFKDSDLIGIPWRVVVSARTLEQGGVELKQRSSSECHIVSIDSLGELKQS